MNHTPVLTDVFAFTMRQKVAVHHRKACKSFSLLCKCGKIRSIIILLKHGGRANENEEIMETYIGVTTVVVLPLGSYTAQKDGASYQKLSCQLTLD